MTAKHVLKMSCRMTCTMLFDEETADLNCYWSHLPPWSRNKFEQISKEYEPWRNQIVEAWAGAKQQKGDGCQLMKKHPALLCAPIMRSLALCASQRELLSCRIEKRSSHFLNLRLFRTTVFPVLFYIKNLPLTVGSQVRGMRPRLTPRPPACNSRENPATS
jgi:hypothetical protein